MVTNTINRLAISLSVLALMVLNSCSKNKEQEVFVFDPSKDYPEFPLSLKDVAEISYIKLGGEDENVYFSSIWDSGVYIDHLHNRIFIEKFYIGVMEFDLHGKFIRRLGRMGRGPGEYLTTYFYVQPEEEKVGIYDEQKDQFLVYTYDGAFHEDEGMNVKLTPLSMSFLIQDNYLVSYTPNSESFYESQNRTVRKRDKTLELFPLSGQNSVSIKDIHYERPLVMPKDWGADFHRIMLPGQLFPSYSGIMMSTYRSDTTYVIDKNFRWRPFLVNLRHNGVEEGCLYPVGETKGYLFLSHQNNLREGRNRMYYFAINKKTKQVYQITKDESNPLPGCLQNKVQLESGGLTKNPEYRFLELYPGELKGEWYEYLPAELKDLVDQCDEDSNPILMIIKFKE